MKSTDGYLKEISELPDDFHEAGVMTAPVLRAIFHYASAIKVQNSMETGCGKSTLLLSWLSSSHTVFTLESYGSIPCESYQNVLKSELLNRTSVNFVLGPSQVTVPNHKFSTSLELALIDGPHGFPFPILEYYYIYPSMEDGALLIVDDIHIPTVRWLHDFLKEDDMFELIEVVEHTAFFRRTSSPTFNPFGDDWWLQTYNANRLNRERSQSNMLSLPRRMLKRLLN